MRRVQGFEACAVLERSEGAGIVSRCRRWRRRCWRPPALRLYHGKGWLRDYVRRFAALRWRRHVGAALHLRLREGLGDEHAALAVAP